MINTEKGKKIFEEIKKNFNFTEVETQSLVKNVKEMLHSVETNEKRTQFFKELNKMNESDFFRKWFPDTIKVKIERTVRVTMAKTGVYKCIKKLAKKILRK